MQARSTFVKSEAMLGIVETEEKSQKDKIWTASKTIWMLTSWLKTLVSVRLIADYGQNFDR